MSVGRSGASHGRNAHRAPTPPPPSTASPAPAASRDPAVPPVVTASPASVGPPALAAPRASASPAGAAASPESAASSASASPPGAAAPPDPAVPPVVTASPASVGPPALAAPPDSPVPRPTPAAFGAGPGIHPDDLPDGLVVADERGRVVCFNTAAVRITAVPAAEALGRPLEQALPLEDLEGRRWWQLTDPYGGLAIRDRQPERNLLLPGGREVLVSARYVRTRPTGPVHRVVVSLRDTEARRRTERSHAELIATVAHELRSPLTSVKGFTATLLAKWERFTDDQKRLVLETVDADADRVTRLIAELLDISRIDSGRLELRRQPVDMGAAVGRHIQAYVAAGQPADRFLLRVQQPLPDLWADPDKIDQVLGNLLENAVRHGEGTVTIDVTPTPAPREGQEDGHTLTSVTVSDEGPGIPEESMNRVFTRFWRGSKRGGTGLGLYIVKGIVEAHGGTITVGRAPGGGAEFRFTLPVGAPAYLA